MGGNPPSTPREFFNMKHSSARNVIERAFGALKGRWAILRGKSYYPVRTHCRIITACCLLHNLITREMGLDVGLEEGDIGRSEPVPLDGENITFIESSTEWTAKRDDLANTMFNAWRQHQ